MASARSLPPSLKIVTVVFLVLWLIIAAFPFLWTVWGSFKVQADFFSRESFWNAIFGGWQTAGIVRINSGLPANVINARVWPTNWNLQGNATCGSRNTNGDVAACPATANAKGAEHQLDLPNDSVPNLFGDPDAAFQAFRFTLPGQRGQRNILRGDGYFNLDLGLSKSFNMPWEGHSLKMQWQVFNVTNSVYFDTVSLTANIGSRATFGDYSAVLGGPRRMQVAFRYEF